MAQGRYERRRRKPPKRFPWGQLVGLAVLLLALVFLLIRCQGGNPNPTEPETTLPVADQTTESACQTEVTTEPTEKPTSKPTEEPTTEPATEPTTEPTEETTEPPTEETTEPPTEPTSAPTEETVLPESTLAGKVAALAKSLVGTDYEFGGQGPDTFDTTGLVYYCFRQSGVEAPRGLSGQSGYGREVPKDQLQPGDVVFFWMSTPGQIEYVGIYVGGGQFVAARKPGTPTSFMDFGSEYFTERYMTARRYYE